MFSVAEHLLAQHNAVKMLHGRIRVILDYIKAVEAGITVSVIITVLQFLCEPLSIR